jgi:two-component system nitrate/nitrite response regulator NarL
LLRPKIEIFVLVSVRLYRDGIADALQQDRRFRVVGSAASLDSARDALDVYAEAPALALVDMDLDEGVDAARTLRSMWPETTIVALAVRENDEEVVSWVEAGVSGLVSRDATLAELLDGVEAAAKGEAFVSRPAAAALMRRVASVAGEHKVANGTLLTRREREILRLVGEGLSNKAIASTLRIELATVKNHVHNILEKLRVRSRTAAVAAARARGELNRI